jgi:hypothetical protein
LDAVVVGHTLEYSSGAVEGLVIRMCCRPTGYDVVAWCVGGHRFRVGGGAAPLRVELGEQPVA